MTAVEDIRDRDDAGDLAGSRGERLAVRAAGWTELALAAGFGGGAVWAVLHLAANGELPLTPWGFRAMAGPFEDLGVGMFSMLSWAFALVCAVDLLAGFWLLQGRRRGLRLGLLTAVAQFLLGLGFALPFLLAGVPLRVLLALAGRRTLR